MEISDGYESTKKRALRILGKRNFSEQEMYKRLVSKGEPEEAAAETVAWLVEMGYINDDSYATLIVTHYASRGYGQARIRDELLRRGIPRELWDEKLSENCSEAGNDEAGEQGDPATLFLTKKLRGSTDKDDLRRAREALVRRGFSYDEASDAVKRYLENFD